MNTSIKTNTAVTVVSNPKYILQSVLTALSHGKISEAVDQFDDDFTFNDQALGLEFTDKGRLSEFFQKSRELFPDTVVEVISTFESGDHVIAEWKLTATQTVSYWIQLQVPISLLGVSIAEIENGRITHWSDYYDEKTSRRVTLASLFTDWIEH
jgi:ketosteroid isomerase-like protein